MSRPAIFLDRDGVLIESRRVPGGSTPPESVDDVAILEGGATALTALREEGYCLVVVTNQPDVARGSKTRAEVEAINAELLRALPLDEIYTCFHDGAACTCRKPRPGMLLDAARDLDLDLELSWLIGDRWVDVAAGAAAGVKTVLIERSWSWEGTSAGTPPQNLAPDHIAMNIAAAADVILGANPGT